MTSPQAAEALRAVWDGVRVCKRPHAVLLTGQPGEGKTWAVRDFYNFLRTEFARSLPALTTSPNTLMADRATFESQRKRVAPELADWTEETDYAWLGVNCTNASWNAESSPETLAHQLEKLADAIIPKEQQEGPTRRQLGLHAARELAGVFVLPVSAVNAGESILRKAIEYHDAQPLPEIPFTEMFAHAMVSDLDGLVGSDGQRLPICIVLDDAHLGEEPVLAGAAAAIRQLWPAEQRRYFEPGDVGLDGYRCLLILTAWSSAMGQLDRFWQELSKTEISVTEIEVGGVDQHVVATMCHALVKPLGMPVDNLVHLARPTTDSAHNPLLVQERLRAIEASSTRGVPVHDLPALLPNTLDESYADRLRDLNRERDGASEALLAAATINTSIPISLFDSIGTDLDGANRSAAVQHGLLTLDDPREIVSFDELLCRYAISEKTTVHQGSRHAAEFLERRLIDLVRSPIRPMLRVNSELRLLTVVATAALRTPQAAHAVRAVAAALIGDIDTMSGEVARAVGEPLEELLPIALLREREALGEHAETLAERLMVNGSSVAELALSLVLRPRLVRTNDPAVNALTKAAEVGNSGAARHLAQALLSGLHNQPDTVLADPTLSWLRGEFAAVSLVIADRFPDRRLEILKSGARDDQVELSIASTLLETGQLGDALDQLRELPNDNADARILRARVFRAADDIDGALAELSAAAEVHQGIAVEYARQLEEHAPDQFERAEVTLRSWVERPGRFSNEHAVMALAEMLEARNRFDEVMQLLASAAHRSANVANRYSAQLVERFKGSETTECQVLEALVPIRPWLASNANSAVLAGRILERNGSTIPPEVQDEIIKGLEAAEGQSPAARMQLGVLVEEDDPDRAQRLLGKAARDGDPRAVLRLAQATIDHDPNAALRWLEMNKVDSRVRLRFLCLLMRTDPETASKQLMGWVRADPESLAQLLKYPIDEAYLRYGGVDVVAFHAVRNQGGERAILAAAFAEAARLDDEGFEERASWCEGSISVECAARWVTRMSWRTQLLPLDRDCLRNATRQRRLPLDADRALLSAISRALGVDRLPRPDAATARQAVFTETTQLIQEPDRSQ